MTPREAFHQFIDVLDDDLAKPTLHVLVDTFPDELVGVALERMRSLRAGVSIYPRELSSK